MNETFRNNSTQLKLFQKSMELVVDAEYKQLLNILNEIKLDYLLPEQKFI